MVTASELRNLTEDEFTKKEKDLKEELFNIRIQVSTKQVNNYSEIKKLKKDIARIETVKREKRSAGGDVNA